MQEGCVEWKSRCVFGGVSSSGGFGGGDAEVRGCRCPAQHSSGSRSWDWKSGKSAGIQM